MKSQCIPISEGLGRYYDEIVDLEQQIIQGANAGEISGYLDEGAVCYVFRLSSDTVVKVPLAWRKDELYDSVEVRSVIDNSVQALRVGYGLPGVEQLRYWSLSQPTAWCAEYVKGCSADSWDASFFQPQQFIGLFDAVEGLCDRGLVTDDSSSNILYAPDQGFTLIDYALPQDEWIDKVRHNKEWVVQNAIADMASPCNIFASREASFREGHVPEEFVLFRGLCNDRYGSEFADRLTTLWRTGVS